MIAAAFIVGGFMVMCRRGAGDGDRVLGVIIVLLAALTHA